jgi:hypothetical protein
MPEDRSLDTANLLTDLSPYIYGTTRLGDETLPFEDRVQMARMAIDSGVWLHTSHTYGNALDVLRVALDQDRSKAPKFIVKLIGSSVDEIRNVLDQNLNPLAMDSLELGQLCLGGQIADDFANGGDCYKAFSSLKAEGRVRRFVVEVFPWTSGMSLSALRGGYTDGIIDGFIFYLNPLQRFASNELWDLMMERQEPMVAMRTVSGGNIHALRDVPGAAWKPYLQVRAAQVAPIFERSGINSWTEFSVRFAHSFPLVRATVGATSKPERLEAFVSAGENVEPLPVDIVDEIVELQYRWSDEVDMHAEHWSM